MTGFQTPEVLYVLAEVSIAVVGFTGVVVALRFQNRDWSEVQLIRFSALIYPSLTALVACFFPDMIGYFTSDTTLVWRTANLGLGLLHLINIIPFIVGAIRSPASTTLGQRCLAAIGLATITGHLFAAASLIPFLQAMFVFGVMQQIGIGIHNFVLSLRDSANA